MEYKRDKTIANIAAEDAKMAAKSKADWGRKASSRDVIS